MYDRNIMIIKDLVNENNNFLTFEEFKNMYQVNITFLDYYGLIHAIPQEYKQKYNHMQIAALKQNIRYTDCYEKKRSQNACILN